MLFPGSAKGQAPAKGRPGSPQTGLPTPVWRSVCGQYAGTHRDIGVLVQDDLEEVRREDGWGFEALLGPVYVHLLAIRSRW